MYKTLKISGEKDIIEENKMKFNKKLKNNKNLCDYLCHSIEEKEEFQKIYNQYDNEYDIITEYRKSRVLRKINQYTVSQLRDVINTQGFNAIKDVLQKMFGDFIEDRDINSFLDTTKKDINTIDLVASKHQNHPLEKLHNLLLLIE